MKLYDSNGYANMSEIMESSKPFTMYLCKRGTGRKMFRKRMRIIRRMKIWHRCIELVRRAYEAVFI